MTLRTSGTSTTASACGRLALAGALVFTGVLACPPPGLAAPAVKGPDPRAEILGEWRGTSVCTDLERAPACKDEVVVYVFTPVPGNVTAVHQVADKIVNGERGTMGELDFTRDAKSGEWRSEFRTPRVHALWSLRVADTLMTGTLVDLPSRAQIRRIRVTRAPRP